MPVLLAQDLMGADARGPGLTLGSYLVTTQDEVKSQKLGALNYSHLSMTRLVWGHSEAQPGARSRRIYYTLILCWAFPSHVCSCLNPCHSPERKVLSSLLILQVRKLRLREVK